MQVGLFPGAVVPTPAGAGGAEEAAAALQRAPQLWPAPSNWQVRVGRNVGGGTEYGARVGMGVWRFWVT